MLTIYDYIAIAFFFLFMLALGPIFKRYSEDDSDFFRGGGQMLWWMVGGSAFMCQFSAWTFTGAASRAYKDGTLVALLFFANAAGFFINYLWFAPRFRRMRIVSPIEGVRERFGPVNEQIFTWLQIPMSLVYSALWLSGLAVFVTAVFGFDMTLTMWVVGIVVIILSVAGGSWAICAGDFVQLLILMAVSIATAFLVLNHVDIGGFSGLVEKVPSHHFNWSEVANSEIIWFWIICTFVHKLVNLNNMQDSYRYLNVKDEKQSRKAALLASVLMLIGPIIWFIPPMAAKVLCSDLGDVFDVKNPDDTAYIYAAMQVLPKGMMGLLVCGLFAATISSMDSGLNRNAGIFVRCFYQRVVKDPSPRHLLRVGQLASAAFGVFIILIAIFINELKGIDLFDAMMLFGGMIAVPYAIPLLWGIVVKNTPAWSGWSTILIGFIVSFILTFSYGASEIGGISSGSVAGDLKFKSKQWAEETKNSNKFGVTGSELSVNDETLNVGNLGFGVSTADTATGLGYMMYSPEVLQNRFGDLVDQNNAEHLLAVRLKNKTWQFSNLDEKGWTDFTPVAGDRLFAEVDFDGDKVSNGCFKYLVNPNWFGKVFDFEDELSSRERKDYLYFAPVYANVAICSLWFLFTSFFYKFSSSEYRERVDKFFTAMNTPIDFEKEVGAGKDSIQSKTLGILCLIYGGFVLLMTLVPNPLIGRLAFLFCGGLIGGVGLLLYRASKKGTESTQGNENE